MESKKLKVIVIGTGNVAAIAIRSEATNIHHKVCKAPNANY